MAKTTIPAGYFAAGSIATADIADDAVTADKLAANSVVSASIVNGTIATADLADDAITQAKIADDAVGANQLAANSVVSASIVNGTIVTADLADDAITAAKIDSTATGMTLADLTVDTNTLKVDASNNRVGIGTASPSHPLHISSTGHTQYQQHRQSSSVGTGQEMKFAFNTADGTEEVYSSLYTEITANTNGAETGTVGLRVADAGSLGYVIKGVGGGDTTLYADGDAVMTLEDGGKVGIGTTSPTHGLTVSDEAVDASASRRITIKSTNHGANAGYRFSAESADGTARSAGYYFHPENNANSSYLALSADDSGTQFAVTSQGRVGINTTTPNARLQITGGSQVGLYVEGNDAGYTQGCICVASDTTDTNGYRGQGMFYFNHGTDTTWYTGGLYTSADRWDICRKSSTTALDESTAQATNSLVSVMPSGSGCAVGINNNNPANFAYFVVQPVASQGTAFQLHNQAGSRRWFYIVDGYYGYQGVEQIYSNGGVNRYFNNASGSTVGSIVVNSGSTSFNTTSDYRLKDNPQPLTGSGDFIDGLQPKTWTWNHGDGGTGVGFIAHEAATVGHGLCVTGEKDAESLDKVWNEETEEYEEQTTPTYQQLDYSSGEIIANMVAELQSLRARVAALEN